MDDCHSEDILFDFDYADDLDALRELEEDGEFIGMFNSLLQVFVGAVGLRGFS